MGRSRCHSFPSTPAPSSSGPPDPIAFILDKACSSLWHVSHLSLGSWGHTLKTDQEVREGDPRGGNRAAGLEGQCYPGQQPEGGGREEGDGIEVQKVRGKFEEQGLSKQHGTVLKGWALELTPSPCH